MNIFGNNDSRSGSARRSVPFDLQATGDLSQAARIANGSAPRSPRGRATARAAGSGRAGRAGRGMSSTAPRGSYGARREGSGAGGARRQNRQNDTGRAFVAQGASARPRAGRAASDRTGARRSSFVRYASDNRVVRALYTITAGPFRLAFYLVVLAAVGFSLYFPLRDLYSAHRTGEVLRAQLAIRKTYNEQVQSDVDKLLSTEGIEDTARQNLGLVKPGETAIDVVGLDDASDTTASSEGDAAADSGEDAAAGKDAADSNDAAAGDSGTNADGGAVADAQTDNKGTSSDASDAEPATSGEALAAEEAVGTDAPWYIQMLDTFFGYGGTNGQKVVSTGASA